MIISERFRTTVRNLEADGELNPTEAENAFEKLMGKVRTENR